MKVFIVFLILVLFSSGCGWQNIALHEDPDEVMQFLKENGPTQKN